MSTDLRPDADVVAMAADIVGQIEEIEALARNRGWPIGPNGEMVRMAAACFRDIIAGHAKERPSRHVALERRGDWNVTHTGRRFWALDPRPDEVELEDVAHNLAMRPRWNSIVLRHYTVGEHSARVAALARHLAMKDAVWSCDPDLAYAYGLFHDAAEGPLADIPRPVKGFLRGWQAIEDGVQKAILEHVGLWPMPVAVEPVVALADNCLLVLEARDPTILPDAVRAEVLYRPEIRDQADEVLDEEAEAAAAGPPAFATWQGGRAWLLDAFRRVAADAAERAAARAKAAESAAQAPAGRREWMKEKPPEVTADDFEPPPHLKRLLEG